METILILIFSISSFIIFWAMVGYPLFLLIINKLCYRPNLEKDFKYEPTVTVMVVAHDEEKVIEDKLDNLLAIDYPHNKFKIVVTSDRSTDKTNIIVKDFIARHSDYNIELHETVDHRGKTNAQNEAQKLVESEILIMTDANCFFRKNAVREIVSCFCDSRIAYVCGSTYYTNSLQNTTADSENQYWTLDSKCREIESRFQTITAGDGNIYACRNCLYQDIPPIECHDSSFPVIYALQGFRAVYNPDAVAIEKAGENNNDEYKRKVRMNRNILHNILPSIRILNVFKYKWFTLFWLSHRTCRYLLWISHFTLLAVTATLLSYGQLWKVLLFMQLFFYFLALFELKFSTGIRILKMISYYSITIASQWHGVYNNITGKSKATWKQAESTR